MTKNSRRANWQIKKLGEICSLIKGKKPSAFVDKSSTPYLTAKVVRKTENPKFASENCPTSVLVNKEDIVIIMDGSNSGEMFTGLEGALASTMGIIRYDRALIDSKYLLHFLISHRENFTKSRTGAAIPHLNKEGFENLKIPLPPLPEQQRIVKILDEVFENIAEAKENTEKNLANSKELFESYKNELFDNKGRGYEEIALKDVCEKITQGPNPKYDKNENEKFRVLKTKNLYDKNIFYEEADRVSESVFTTCRSSELRDGDVLLAIVGKGSINKCNVFENKTPYRFIYTRALGLIRTNKLMLDPYYLKDFLQSKKGKHLIDYGIGGTSGQQVVTTTHIKALKIPLPCLIEQKSIVAKLDALSAETKKLESIYKQKIAGLEELKKSVLKKAFDRKL